MLSRRQFMRGAGLLAGSLGLASCASASAGGNSDSNESQVDEAVSLRAAALKGPTAMGLVKFMSDVDSGVDVDAGSAARVDYSFQIVASADEVTPLISKGEVDIAAVPANLASVLYNKTEGAVRAICINTLGVLYICELGDSIQTVADLRGKTIYSAGKGSTPEYALEYVLEAAGLDPASDVTIEWKSEHSECVTALAADAAAVAMLPQPFVTTAQAKNDQIRVALDLNAEWKAACEAKGDDGRLITGVAIARTEFAEAHPEAVEAFLRHYQESVDYVTSNVAEAAKLVGDYGIVTEEVAAKALPACNITFITGSEMRARLESYLAVLESQNAQAVGGKLPGDDFYFGA